MLVSKDRLLCFFKSLFFKLKKTASRKERWQEYGSIYKLRGSSMKMLILFHLNIYMGWKKNESLHSKQMILFPQCYLCEKCCFWNQMRNTQQRGGSVKSLVRSVLASHKFKTFLFWVSEKAGTQTCGVASFVCPVSWPPHLAYVAPRAAREMPKREV